MALPALAVVGQVVSAIADLPRAITSFASSITSMTDAIDPQSTKVFHEAIRSVSATMGFAFLPAIQGLTQLVRELAGELMAPFTDLQSVVGELTGALTAVVRPILSAFGEVMRTVVDVVKALMPAVLVVTAVLEGLANVYGIILRVQYAIYAAVIEAIAGFFDLDGVVDLVRNAFVQATVTIIRFVDVMLRAVGMTEAANRFLRGLAREPNQGGRPGALQNVQVTDLQSIYKQRLQAAAAGTQGVDVQAQSRDYLQEIARTARDLLQSNNGVKSNGERLFDFFDSLLKLFGGRTPPPRPQPRPEAQPGGAGGGGG